MTTYQETSAEAWQHWLGEPSTKADLKILFIIERLGGATDYDVELVTGMKHQTVSGNRRHLVEKGRVVDSGLRNILPTGRRAIVWKIASTKEGK